MAQKNHTTVDFVSFRRGGALGVTSFTMIKGYVNRFMKNCGFILEKNIQFNAVQFLSFKIKRLEKGREGKKGFV